MCGCDLRSREYLGMNSANVLASECSVKNIRRLSRLAHGTLDNVSVCIRVCVCIYLCIYKFVRVYIYIYIYIPQIRRDRYGGSIHIPFQSQRPVKNICLKQIQSHHTTNHKLAGIPWVRQRHVLTMGYGFYLRDPFFVL
jgi:hypothetical protein